MGQRKFPAATRIGTTGSRRLIRPARLMIVMIKDFISPVTHKFRALVVLIQHRAGLRQTTMESSHLEWIETMFQMAMCSISRSYAKTARLAIAKHM